MSAHYHSSRVKCLQMVVRSRSLKETNLCFYPDVQGFKIAKLLVPRFDYAPPCRRLDGVGGRGAKVGVNVDIHRAGSPRLPGRSFRTRIIVASRLQDIILGHHHPGETHTTGRRSQRRSHLLWPLVTRSLAPPQRVLRPKMRRPQVCFVAAEVSDSEVFTGRITEDHLQVTCGTELR